MMPRGKSRSPFKHIIIMMNYIIIMILIYSIHLELKSTSSVNIHQDVNREIHIPDEMMRRTPPRDKIDEIIYEFSEPKNPSKLLFQPINEEKVISNDIENLVKVSDLRKKCAPHLSFFLLFIENLTGISTTYGCDRTNFMKITSVPNEPRLIQPLVDPLNVLAPESFFLFSTINPIFIN